MLKASATASLLGFVFHVQPSFAAGGCALTFVPSGTFGAGVTPQAVAVGDFNRDGKRDLVVVNQFSANVSVLLGNGDGTFQAAVNYGVGQGPTSVAVGDFDGDNKLDLAVANSTTGDISVLLGNGDGTFGPTNNFSVGSSPSAITARDLNGDGFLDLAVANRASGDLSVLIGNGDGTFMAADFYLVDADPLFVATGDFNNDARPDLAVANAALFSDPPSVSVLLARSQQSGTFQGEVSYDAGISPRAVAVGDFNKDGKLDLVVANYGQLAGSSTTNSSVPVLLGRGDGTFSNAVHYLAGAGPIAVAVADLDGDTNLDLVIANERANTISIMLGNGNGTFQPTNNFSAGSNPRSLAVADFNGDGKPDIAVVNTSGVLVLLSACQVLADLAITKADAPDPVNVGNQITYTLAITNSGPVSVPDTTVTDPLPTGVSFVSAVASQGTCTNIGGTVTCSLGLMTNGAQASVTITVTANTAGQITNTASVSSAATTDPNLTNNTASVSTTARPVVSIVATDSSASETGPDPGVFTVSRTGGTAAALTVNYSIGGTASNGVDYASLSGVITLPIGAASATITVSPVNDPAPEGTETVIATLTSNAAYAINPSASSATVNILDNDAYSVAINDVALNEGNSGTTNAVFTLTLSYPHTQTVTVNYATANGTAVAGSDYLATNGIASFAPGTTNAFIVVNVIGDLLNETNESFFVNLSNPTNAILSDVQGIGTIVNDDPLPSLSINDVTVMEGTSGFTNAIFTVSLSAASGQSVSVNYATAAGTATAGSDYVSTNGTLAFPPGTTTQTITVRINGDTIAEPTENYFVNLSNPVNATINDSQGVGMILNATSALSVNDVSITEGDSGTTNAVFTVSLSFTNFQTITVSYATADGTATAGADYVSTNGMLTFPPGTSNQTVSVTVLGDVLNEANETFFVNLSNPTNATIAKVQGVGTIANDDPLPTVAISDATVMEGDFGSINATFTVNLSVVSGQSVSVNYATADGTATAGNDYVSTSGTLTFPPGTTSQTVSVAVLGDLLNESDETFFVNLSNPTNTLIADGQGLGTILNNDPLPSLSINDVTVTEGNGGTTNAVFTVSLSTASGQFVGVNFSTADGTAVAGSDYVSTNGTLTFSPGVTTQTIAVRINGDVLNEPNETFFVNLSNPINATFSDSQGAGTIANDDPLPSLSIGNVTLSEGNVGTTDAVFAVSLSAASGQTVTVSYATVNGTATAGSDYAATNGVLTFAPGTVSQNVTVKVTGDVFNEDDETFFVNLSSPANAVLGNGQGLGTIVNDDPLPSIFISDVNLAEGNSGTTNAVFTLTLSPASGRSVTVNFATADGTAIAGGDYVATNGTITFPPGTTTQTLAVKVIGELVYEANENFFVNLSNPNNATLADTQGIGTIVNDDPLPSVSISDAGVVEGNNGTTNALFTVSLSAPSGSSLSINFTTANGTALAGSDYAATNGTLMFTPGTTSQTLAVTVFGDTSSESNETFFVNLSNPTNAVLGRSQGVGTITNDDPLASITIYDSAIFEGSSSTNPTMAFNVNLSGPSGLTITVNYATANGTAKGNDYTATSGTLTFTPGQTNRTINVTISGDNTVEGNDTFFVNLSSPVNATLARSQATGTILNDDGVPSLSISGTTVVEGNSGTTNAVFNVQLSAPSSDVVTAYYGTSDGTAVAGQDYVATNGYLTFAAGVTNQTVVVPVIGDVSDEPNETFFVNLIASTNATISAGQGMCTIIDDDGQAAVSIADSSVTEGNSNTVNLLFTVSLSPASGQTVTVNYATSDGTATAGSDYAATNGILSFPPGITSRTVAVTVFGDVISEPNETLFVTLSNPVNATLADGLAVGTINNDDGVPNVNISDVRLLEGNSGTTNAVFNVSLSIASAQTVTLSYATSNGTANASSDYVSTNGSITFPPGVTNQTIAVQVLGDVVNEADETFFVNLSNPFNATIGNGVGTGTIANDDPAPALTINDVIVVEGNSGTTNAVFTVTLSPASGQTVTVNYATADGTAVAVADYLSTSGLLSFPAGTITQTITVPVVGDTISEATENFFVNLSNPANAVIADGQGICTINNDDSVPALSINDVSVAESNSGTNALFTVSLTAPSGQTVTVNFATTNGSATAGSDYAATNGVLTFVPGTTTQTIAVAIFGDLLNEPNETFFVNLSSPVNATISNSQGMGTIINDDGLPGISINDVTIAEGDSGTTDAVFTVSVSAPSAQTITVNYATAAGSATAGSDYFSTNGLLTFAPGITSQTIVVKVIGDILSEGNETFFVNLSNPTNAVLTDGQGLGTIANDDAAAILSIGNAAVAEGNSGTTNAVFTVTLSPPSGQTVTVNFSTADGTAVAGSDYSATNGSLTFPSGSTSQTITVKVNGDTINENNEVFFVNLSNPVNAGISVGQGTGTIVNDDGPPTLSISDAVVTEGNTGTTNAIFTVTLSASSGQGATVNYATADGSATAGADYIATNGILNFAPGITTQTLAVAVKGDLVNEANETFLVNLSNPTNAVLNDGVGVGTIINDDPVPSLSISDVTVTEGNSGTTNALFIVSLSPASGQAVTVGYTTTDGSANAGSDYVATNGTVTFAAGVTTQTVAVTVNGDTLNETDENFFVVLSNPVNASVAGGQGIGTISNDDPVPTVSVGDATVVEGNSGTTNALFAVSLSSPSGQFITVGYGTVNGTAQSGSDYMATNGSLSLPPGATNAFIVVPVLGDSVNEPNETFFVNLTLALNATISRSQGIGTILNDDGPPSLSINDSQVVEGNAGTTNMVFTVTLSPASGLPVTVSYATANGTALAGSDYVTTNGLLSFPAGSTSQTLAVKVNGDLVNEANETILVNLSNATNAIIADSQGVGTILNDDPLPSLAINDVTLVEGNSGTTNAVFTVTLSPASGQTVTVAFATSNGTATAGADYVATNGVLTFAAGVTSQTLTVRVNGDTLNEAAETFFVNLSNATNASLADAQGMGTIVNDDPVPAIAISDVSVVEGNSGSTNAIFTVSLTAVSGQPVTVNFTTADGTAVAGSDYVATSGLVTFAAGTTNQTIAVSVLGDSLNESNETYFVNLSNPTNATISDSQGVGTIVNDDPVVSISISDTAQFEGNSGTTNMTFNVSLSAVSGQTVTVNYSTADGTASRLSDYTRINSGTITFPPGTTNQTINVVVTGDTTVETNETLFVNLSSAVNATIANGQGVGTILNDDGVPTISISDATVTEGQTGTTNAVFAVRLSASSSQVVTVNFATGGGSATAGVDYLSTNGIVTFPAGSTNQNIIVKVVGDQLSESNETFFVNLSGSINALISDGTGLGTILDDDPFNLQLSTNSITMNEGGSNSFSVRLLSAPASNVSVTVTRTAGSTNLIVASGGTLIFTPVNWSVFQPVVIGALEDANVNDDVATFTVALAGSQQLVTATAFDNDLPVLRITAVEFASGNVNIRFSTVANRSYQVQRIDGLSAGSWINVDGTVSGTGAEVQVTDVAGAGQSSRFYRVLQLP